MINSKLLNSDLRRACVAGDYTRERANPIEGFTSRTRHFGVLNRSRWIRVVVGSLGVPRPASAFGAKEPEGG